MENVLPTKLYLLRLFQKGHPAQIQLVWNIDTVVDKAHMFWLWLCGPDVKGYLIRQGSKLQGHCEIWGALPLNGEFSKRDTESLVRSI